MKILTSLLILIFQQSLPSAVTGQVVSVHRERNPNKPELVVQSTHTGSILSLSVNPKGTIVASGGSDGAIQLWDTKSRRQIRSLLGHSKFVRALAFSPTEDLIASGSYDKTVRLWNINTGKEVLNLAADAEVDAIAFSSDGIKLASGDKLGVIKTWNVKTGRAEGQFLGYSSQIRSLAFSSSGDLLASGAGSVRMEPNVNLKPSQQTFVDAVVKIWNVKTGKEFRTFKHERPVIAVRISPDESTVTAAGSDNVVKRWDIASGNEILSVKGASPHAFSGALSVNGDLFASSTVDGSIEWLSVLSGRVIQKRQLPVSKRVEAVTFSLNGKVVVSGGLGATLTFWITESGESLVAAARRVFVVSSVRFSPDGTLLAMVVGLSEIKLWDLAAKKSPLHVRSLRKNRAFLAADFSPDGSKIVSSGLLGDIDLWDVKSGELLLSLKADRAGRAALSADGKKLLSIDETKTVTIWDAKTGGKLETLKLDDPGTAQRIEQLRPGFTSEEALNFDFSKDLAALADGGNSNYSHNRTTIFDRNTGAELCTLISLNLDDWIVVAPNGRFDTNVDLSETDVLHWLVPDAPLTALPLEIFMRQYYEPNLLPRLLACNRLKCPNEFQAIRDFSSLNRAQPEISIVSIKPASVPGIVDVSVKAENVISSFQKDSSGKPLESGVYDIRLFRGGQLVAVSTPKEKLTTLIQEMKNTSTNAEDRFNTREERAWREACDVFKIDLSNAKLIAPGKIEYTFHNIKLPQDGRNEVVFTAYAFNSDRVKSTTSLPVTYSAFATTPGRKGRAYLLSIGVSASERPAYALPYAANEARKMQEIVGARLQAASAYSEVIKIPLISEKVNNKTITENTAQKAIIKAVFSLLAGNDDVPESVLRLIPGHETIRPIEPEDTLIITYAGHGYADLAGAFHFVPYDVGAGGVNNESLQNTISTDELAMWMQNITADEMVMIIDACQSEEAIVGNHFKPAPMGSSGLGQLAYDKGMKILSATQSLTAENSKFRQGILSYALLQEGIVESRADIDRDGKLGSTEWLSFAEKRVPQLIEKSNGSTYQQPSLFDFRRRNLSRPLLALR